ncbi:hypothetical protein [Rhodoblastus acidophilus]|uniref:hypothetical protein n=1 Tax=Rhodoblastus acidophilus TaxID=1074 RepID=UPI000B501A15|nr:hypothetical protein [Rhodoblastus acidophilus]PPQ35418.1 hypothetical protein CKO16_20665 [Rhodoblastus acidophilus]RAI17043.1 hypothetical protein CH337_18280 [Rhodoblastus acidophilus]
MEEPAARRFKNNQENKALDASRLIAEREKTHGSFAVQARVAQLIKAAIREGLEGREVELPAAQQEALDLIATKMGRIVAGDAGFKDHWDDIQGYARLGRGA